MKKHRLKITRERLDELLAGRKRAEIRENDRDFQLGDTLELYLLGTDKTWEFKVTHVHSGLGMQHSYVALSVEKL